MLSVQIGWLSLYISSSPSLEPWLYIPHIEKCFKCPEKMSD